MTGNNIDFINLGFNYLLYLFQISYVKLAKYNRKRLKTQGGRTKINIIKSFSLKEVRTIVNLKYF